MLRLAFSILALAAFLPLSAGAAPFQPFNVFDPTPRGVILDGDYDGYSQNQLWSYIPNPAFVPDPNYRFLFGYDHTDPTKAPFIRGSRPDNNNPLINQFEGTGLGEPFNDTPLTKASGDEFLVNAGLQTVFGLDCNLAGVSGNGATPDCLFSDPNTFGTAGGGDPLISLGIDGFGIVGLNGPEPAAKLTDYIDVSVGQAAPSTQAGLSGSSTILAFDPNNPASLAQRADIRLNQVAGGALPGIGANGPQYGPVANPYRVANFGPGSAISGPAAALAGTSGLVMAVHEDYVDKRIVPFPDPNFPLAKVAPMWDPNPLSFSTPALWTSNGSVGTVTLKGSQVADLFMIGAIGTVLQVSPDFTNLDPNDPTSTLAHGCNFYDPLAVVAAIGCFNRDSTSAAIPILGGPDMIKPWSDMTIEIDLVGGQFEGRSNVMDLRVTHTGTFWDTSSNSVAVLDTWQQTYAGPWIDPNEPGFESYSPIPGVNPGIQQAVQITTGATSFFCSTDSTQPPALGVSGNVAPTWDSSPAGSGGGLGATSGGDVGGGPGAMGVNGLVWAQKTIDLSDAMLESPCHVQQTIPYDIYTGVFRALGPAFAGGLASAGDTWGTGGLREVPEPGTLLLLGVGLAGLAAMRRRKA
jgi:hypothetical protein